MKLIIDIDDNVFTRLFDNGVDTSSDDREVIDRAVRNGILYEEKPQGKWELHGMIYYCSNCGHYSGESGDNFCGNCGADMRGTE